MNDIRLEMAADNCEVLRARLAKYEDAEGRPVDDSEIAAALAMAKFTQYRSLGYTPEKAMREVLKDAKRTDLESQAREIKWLTREAKNDAIAYKAAIERQDELHAELAALKAQPSGVGAVPDALARAFITCESGGAGYRVVVKSETLQESQQVHNWLARLNSSPVIAGVGGATAAQILAGQSIPSPEVVGYLIKWHPQGHVWQPEKSPNLRETRSAYPADLSRIMRDYPNTQVISNEALMTVAQHREILSKMPGVGPLTAEHIQAADRLDQLYEQIGEAIDKCRSVNHSKLFDWLGNEQGVTLADVFGPDDSFEDGQGGEELAAWQELYSHVELETEYLIFPGRYTSRKLRVVAARMRELAIAVRGKGFVPLGEITAPDRLDPIGAGAVVEALRCAPTK